MNIKVSLDKYDISLFISNSIEDFKLNRYQNFQLLRLCGFIFILRVSHRLLYCVNVLYKVGISIV